MNTRSAITQLSDAEIFHVAGGAFSSSAYGKAGAVWAGVAVGAAAFGLEPVAFAAGLMAAYDSYESY